MFSHILKIEREFETLWTDQGVLVIHCLSVQSPLLTSVYVLDGGAGTNQFCHGPT